VTVEAKPLLNRISESRSSERHGVVPMKEFETSPLLNTFRATLKSLEVNQGIDQHYLGICELKSMLMHEIQRIESREPVEAGKYQRVKTL
jgi:hypothetical protein